MKPLTYYETTHFRIEELVPRDLYEDNKGRQTFLWSLFSPYLLWTADAIRDHYGVPMVCNDWLGNGRFHGRGFRTPNYPAGAALSAHKRGIALDLWPGGDLTGKDIREDIINFPWWEPFQFITCVEYGVRHLHFDLRNYDREINGIMIVHP